MEALLFLTVAVAVVLLARCAKSRAARVVLCCWAVLPLCAGIGFLTFWAMHCDVNWVKGDLCSQAPLVKGAFAGTLLSAGGGLMLAIPVALLSAFLEWKARRI